LSNKKIHGIKKKPFINKKKTQEMASFDAQLDNIRRSLLVGTPQPQASQFQVPPGVQFPQGNQLPSHVAASMQTPHTRFEKAVQLSSRAKYLLAALVVGALVCAYMKWKQLHRVPVQPLLSAAFNSKPSVLVPPPILPPPVPVTKDPNFTQL